jgi:Polyphosphate kinase 2 (PPK2)
MPPRRWSRLARRVPRLAPTRVPRDFDRCAETHRMRASEHRVPRHPWHASPGPATLARDHAVQPRAARGGSILARAAFARAGGSHRTRREGKQARRMKRTAYEKALKRLQAELCHLQRWLNGLRVIIIFEGRDGAGKGRHDSRRGTSSAPTTSARPVPHFATHALGHSVQAASQPAGGAVHPHAEERVQRREVDREAPFRRGVLLSGNGRPR